MPAWSQFVAQRQGLEAGPRERDSAASPEIEAKDDCVPSIEQLLGEIDAEVASEAKTQQARCPDSAEEGLQAQLVELLALKKQVEAEDDVEAPEGLRQAIREVEITLDGDEDDGSSDVAWSDGSDGEEFVYDLDIVGFRREELHPATVFGPLDFQEMAESVAEKATESGAPGLWQELVRIVKEATDHAFGTGSSRRLGRFDNLVSGLAGGMVHIDDDPELGERRVVSYVTGLLPEEPFHDWQSDAYRPWVEQLEAQASVLAKEMKDGLASKVDIWSCPGAQNDGYDPDWYVLPLLREGSWTEYHALVPKTRIVLDSLGLRIHDASYERMVPKSRRRPDSDDANYILTVHLPLDFEEGMCSLTVGNWTRKWAAGKCLGPFDATYIHSAVNNSNCDRYVLSIRFWHPCCTDEERFAIAMKLSIVDLMKEQFSDVLNATRFPHLSA